MIPSDSDHKKIEPVGLTGRSVALGLALTVATVWMVSYAELVSGQIMIGYLQIPPVAVFLLFVVAAVNMAVRHFWPRRALRAAELATIYAMMVPAAMVASHGLLQRILPIAVAGNYYADSSNGWIVTYFPHTPSWLVIWNPNGPAKQHVAVQFYEGLRRGESLPWLAWLRPLAAWLTLFAMVYGAFLAMSAILRKQWVERERLSFPLVQLPLEMIQGAGADFVGDPSEGIGGFFRSRLAWLGFAIPFAIFALNGIHHAYPTVPQIPLTMEVSPLLTTPPWNGISYCMIDISFAAIGLFYLLPTELLFSLWFFYLLGKVEEIVYAAHGIVLPQGQHGTGRLMIVAQTEGAWIMLAILTLAFAKPHLQAVWRAVWSSSARERGEGEMLSYRFAFWLLIACCIGIVAWCAAAGMSVLLAVAVFGLYLFVQAIIMARSTAEAGMIMTEGSWTPTDVISMAVSPHSLGAANLTVLSYTDAVFPRDLRCIMLTVLFDMQKIADGVGLRLRSLKTALILAIVTAVVFGCALQIWLPYHYGADTLYTYMYTDNPTQFFNEYMPDARPGPPPALYGAGWYALLGAAITLALGILRARISWWPLHPLGYALQATWTIVVFWFSILVAWTVKSSVLRYGGVKIYRLLRPLFIGMILGEFSAAAVWTLISALTHATAPSFPWP